MPAPPEYHKLKEEERQRRESRRNVTPASETHLDCGCVIATLYSEGIPWGRTVTRHRCPLHYKYGPRR